MRYVAFALVIVGCGGPSDLGFSEKDESDQGDQHGVLEFSPGSLVWADLDEDLTQSASLTITSGGEGDLEIERVDITNSGNGVFNLDEEANKNLVVAPGDSIDVLVTAQLDDPGAMTGEIRIRSNDEDTPDMRVVLCAYTLDQGESVNNCIDVGGNESEEEGSEEEGSEEEGDSGT